MTIRVRSPASKYGNEKVEVDGLKFSSKKEARRYGELKLMERAKVIKDLKCQVPFEIIPKQEGERAANYVADFTYYELVGGEIGKPPFWNFVVEDTKGYRTETYRLKRKLMLFVHVIRITET